MPPALKEALEKKKEEKEKASNLKKLNLLLEEVEAEETVDLSVGNDESETESAEASVRSELVEFMRVLDSVIPQNKGELNMALKPDRIETQTDVSFFMNNATSSTIVRGGVASVSTGGPGVAMDDSGAVVSYATATSGCKPVGVLLNDVVNIDLTRQHINWHKDEVQGN